MGTHPAEPSTMPISYYREIESESAMFEPQTWAHADGIRQYSPDVVEGPRSADQCASLVRVMPQMNGTYGTNWLTAPSVGCCFCVFYLVCRLGCLLVD